MSKRSDSLELFLYKTKLNTKSLVDVIPHLSSKTIDLLIKDLQIFEKQENQTTDEKVYVFTDGGCKKNGKKDAKAAYGVFFDDDHPFNKSGLVISEPTNQRAELIAILRCLEIISEYREQFISKQVIIITDSIYSINCITKWSKNWKLNGWKTSKGELIKNKETIKDILDLYETLIIDCKISFQHVFSHTKEPAEKDTLAYKLWYGNYKVDKYINELLEKEYN